MSDARTTMQKLGLSTADILIPAPSVDLKKWAVVACDQYTSEPEYWKRVDSFVGSSPSTLRLIYPEVYLGEADKEERIKEINRTMESYLKEGVFQECKDCFILVHRTTSLGRSRWGLMAALDLEAYDYGKDSKSLVRATEGTILSRIPPRKEIREHAPLEVPHIMVLIDDAKKKVIEPLAAKSSSLRKVYKTELMEGGGFIEAFLVNDESDIQTVADAFQGMYDALDPANPLLFAMGDGNHSMATAKSCWEDKKKTLTPEQQKTNPARYALVELENIHDPGLVFEPIHRILFGCDHDAFTEVIEEFAESGSTQEAHSIDELEAMIRDPAIKGQKFGFLDKDGYLLYVLENPVSAIAAGTLQHVIDTLTEGGEVKVDYVHGKEIVDKLGKAEGNCGLLLPDVSKETFFQTILHDRALPRKTFSMGEAAEKRFYMEARRII